MHLFCNRNILSHFKPSLFIGKRTQNGSSLSNIKIGTVPSEICIKLTPLPPQDYSPLPIVFIFTDWMVSKYTFHVSTLDGD